MKKLLLSVCIAVCSTTAMNAQNMIDNGGFESLPTLHQPTTEGGAINYANNNPKAPLVSNTYNYTSGDTQWRLRKSNIAKICSDFYTGADVYAGTQSLKLAVDNGHTANVPWYNNVVYRSLPIESDKKYEVKLWAKGNAQLYAQFQTNGVATGGQPSKMLKETDGWAQYTFSLDVAARDNSAVTNLSDFAEKTIFAVAIVTAGSETSVGAKYAWVDNIEVSVVTTSGIEGNSAENIAMYVNNKTIYFNMDETHKVSVYNILGSLVKSQYIAPNESLAIANEGCYIIKVANAKGKTSTQKLIIR